MKTTTDLQKEEILPYPHQTDGEEYPEWEKITEFAIEGKDQPDEQKGLILYSKIMQYYHKLSSPQQKSKKEDSG